MMKRKIQSLLAFSVLAFGSLVADTANPKFAVVDVKICVEQSKLGKQEQANFEALKKQMETIILQKDKEVTELTGKLNDPDYLDSISADAETELKRKFRTLSQELGQMQTQYYQTLQQANFKVMQSIGEAIGTASDIVAKDQGLDFIINDEVCFFVNEKFDISKKVITQMDIDFEKSAQDETNKANKALLK